MSPLELTSVAGGTRFRLRVKPGARKSAIVGVHGGALKVSVNAPPDRGRANESVVELLADVLDLPTSAVEIVAGASSQDKTVVVALPPEAVRAKLGKL